MTPEQALSLLDSVVAKLQADRKTTLDILSAVQVLAGAIKPKEEKATPTVAPTLQAVAPKPKLSSKPS